MKKRFILSPVTIILSVIILATVSSLISYIVLYQTEIINIVITCLISLSGLLWVYFVATNSYIIISDKNIVMPRKYSVNGLWFGFTFALALFKKKEILKITEINSVDIVVGYNGSLESTHQPMTIKMNDGTQHVFFMKMYSKMGVVWILKNIKETNPQVNLSKSCSELVGLNNSFKLTGTEKSDFKSKKKSLYILLGVSLVIILTIVLIGLSGKTKTEIFNIVGTKSDYHNGPQIILYTDREDINFRVDYSEHLAIYPEISEFLKAQQENPSLKNNVEISYTERVGIFRNIIGATLSNGQYYKLSH